MNSSNKKLAVLIDADNAPADCIEDLLEEIAKYGTATVKRIYGDWSHGLLQWKAALLPHAIIPVQQFAYTKGKNATDMALVIDAMDLLYSGNFDGFCLVSSDSDFTRLASRIRESGLAVYGFGEQKTPESFRKACDKFIYIEVFRPQKTNAPKTTNKTKTTNENKNQNNINNLTQLIKRAVKETADDFGWANLGPIGSHINKINPEFDSRLYGFSKLSELIKSLELFETRTDNNQLQIRQRKNEKNDTKPNPETNKQPENHAPTLEELSAQIEKIIQQNTLQQGEKAQWATLNAVGQQLKNEQPQLNLKTYGHNRLSSLIKAIKHFECEGNYVRIKPKTTVPSKINSKNESPNKSTDKQRSFSKLILLTQEIIVQHADSDGWAAAAKVAKQLEQDIDTIEQGFASGQDIIHAIYDEWIEKKKVGRGERLRINKPFKINN